MKAYLDYAATTPLDKDIFRAMLPYLEEEFGNPDSLHEYGRKAAYAISEARDRVAQTLGVKPAEVYFTSGGTEADNWAVRCLGTGSRCVSSLEHAAVLETAKELVDTTYAAAGEGGLVSAESVAQACNADTALVCVMAVNNETGCIQPIEEISALCKQRNILLFSDCVQAATTQDMKALCKACDAVSLSGHKLYGPKGTGALIVRSGVPFRPLITGGEQERDMRGGTLNVAGIVGFSYALEKAQRLREEFSRNALALRNLFEKQILSALDAVKIDGENRAPNISHVTFEKGGEWLLNKLDLLGVACSGGAACSAHSALPSHVMLAMGRGEDEALKGVRFSFGRNTTEEEVLFAADAVIRCVSK